MRKPAKFLTTASAIMMLLGAAALAPTAAMAVDAELAAKGKRLLKTVKKVTVLLVTLIKVHTLQVISVQH